MRMRFWGAIVLAAGASALAVWIGARWGRDPQQESPQPILQATRLEPPPEAGAEIESEPFARVDFVYLVRNNGTEPIRGLKLGLACQCEATEEPPAEIPPGGTARIGFRLRSANAGTLRRRIELVSQEAGEVLSSLDVALRAKFEPPALMQPPERTRLTFVDGDDAPRELAFESMEKADSASWISGLEVEPKALLQVTMLPVEHLPHADPSFARRVYRFQLSRGPLPVGTHGASFVLRTRCDPPAMESHLPLEAEVLDRVAIIPRSLSIVAVSGKFDPAQILVMRRAGQGTIEAGQWDRELLDVRRTGGNGERTAAFAIVPKSLAKAKRETKIVFRIGEGQTREAAVKILPDGSPPRSL